MEEMKVNDTKARIPFLVSFMKLVTVDSEESFLDLLLMLSLLI